MALARSWTLQGPEFCTRTQGTVSIARTDWTNIRSVALMLSSDTYWLDGDCIPGRSPEHPNPSGSATFCVYVHPYRGRLLIAFEGSIRCIAFGQMRVRDIKGITDWSGMGKGNTEVLTPVLTSISGQFFRQLEGGLVVHCVGIKGSLLAFENQKVIQHSLIRLCRGAGQGMLFAIFWHVMPRFWGLLKGGSSEKLCKGSRARMRLYTLYTVRKGKPCTRHRDIAFRKRIRHDPDSTAAATCSSTTTDY